VSEDEEGLVGLEDELDGPARGAAGRRWGGWGGWGWNGMEWDGGANRAMIRLHIRTGTLLLHDMPF
jgi:hypothetical protein